MGGGCGSFRRAAAARRWWIPMNLLRSNLGVWLSSGMSLRPVGRPRAVRFHRVARFDRGTLQALAAGPRSRLALAAALVVASLLSPGARDACAGCCDDGSPSVAAPLAAGIAPVHAAAVVATEPHRCCQFGSDAVASGAGSCCPSAEPGTGPETACCEASSGPSDTCGCELTSRDESPVVPVRSGSDDLQVVAASAEHGFHATADDAGRMPFGIVGPVLPVHARPLRVLYGVWRN